ncbi:mediator of RNA polymerase II transcription subunit 31-A isoform X1 [Ischnura elegans]|uniref:mediator of RNA polymerase II transcription subunit 31-A isoform X1 n=1 Tax=Ischnura elegans TaxID=197161 RepID=UPI001ED8B070|nr:mediator of RNA polymerase II transcription subunit 31-A isoform X1 [Ischnura elegans]
MYSGISSHIPSGGNMQGARMSDGGTETEDQQRLRFMVELEFVQCLANPNYLNFLAQRGYFKDQAFINYLKYLLYWKEPDYARYLKYPMCLYFLDLLQYEHFRREVVNAQCTKFIDDQQILLWQHYTRRRTRLLQSQVGTHNSVGIGGVMAGQQPIPTGGSTPIQSGQGGQTPNQTMTRKT